MRLLIVLGLLVLLFLGASTWIHVFQNAQCAADRYGDDCTCTSDLAAVLQTVSTTLTCSDGVWNATGPVIINSLVDIMYDRLWVPDPSGGGTAITIPNTGNLTLHVRQHPDLTVENGFVETPGTVNVNGHIHLIFDRLEQATWSIQYMIYGSLVGSPQLGYSSNATEFTCRNQTTPSEPFFSEFEARFNNTVTNTATKCGFNKGSRDWAIYAFIGIASFGGLVIIFSIFTCVINPWRKLIWYPPM